MLRELLSRIVLAVVCKRKFSTDRHALCTESLRMVQTVMDGTVAVHRAHIAFVFICASYFSA